MAWLRSRSYLFLALGHLFISQGYSQLVTDHDGISRQTVPCCVLIFINGIVNQYKSANMMDIRPMHFWGIGGWIMEAFCPLPGDSADVVDALLRWQPEQAVLCNMRRACLFMVLLV